jgi:hypothetical protein
MHVTVDIRGAWKLLKAWYDAWDRDENRSHMEQYYSMSMKCEAWINGKARDQYEAVKPVRSVSEFGPMRTRYPGQIACIIESIRSVVTSRRDVIPAMDPLAVAEETLGSVDTWPSSVLTDMFYEEPKVSVSRRVAVFLHGNGVSAKDAAKLYKASQAAWRNVSETYVRVVYAVVQVPS